ncbi:MAG TPA: tRNA (adenosine(37)-N6)-threonylcarbamoyltransferase complex dimerization subunit type 1 TsaB [Steroidobacteraceae bacterium]|nr:tRNA (adenosine(37)-N6)-threonylcarbamoyltransferase complex dimerization subunit type 1 TsaB [Steroidobacteraceae bacterium]
MKLLAIDTATERCSVALIVDRRVIERATETARGHADLVLPMVEEVLAEAGLTLRQLDGLAYGRGPGAFTGVRIAVGVAQGLAYGAQLATVGISDLAAVAQQFAVAGARILVCMDARMNEVYWCRFEAGPEGLVRPTADERVERPEAVDPGDATVFAGTGFGAYPQLGAGRAGIVVHKSVLPHAREIAQLAAAELRAGRGEPPEQAQPVYLRDQVATVKAP